MIKRSKKTPTFLKGVALGAVVAMVTLVASAAVAGTGVGRIFNLGQENRVNARTLLEGSTPSALLRLTNSNKSASAGGLSIDVASGRPPLAVNSSTKVGNLNADLLDGTNSSDFQRVVSKTCDHGTAIGSISPNGAAACTTSVVLPIKEDLPADTGDGTEYPPSSLKLAFACSNPGTGLFFENVGTGAATLNWMFSQGGATSTVNAGGQTIAANGNLPFSLSGTRLEGQFIYSDPAGVTTVNLHILDMGVAGCEWRGTAEEALTP